MPQSSLCLLSTHLNVCWSSLTFQTITCQWLYLLAQACWGRYTDWQVMTPTESWNSPRLTACLPASRSACLYSIPRVQKSNYSRHINAVFIKITPIILLLTIIIVQIILAPYTSVYNSQPSRCLSLTGSVSLLLVATGLPRVFPLSPSLPVTFLLFFYFYRLQLSLKTSFLFLRLSLWLSGSALTIIQFYLF